MSKVVASAVLAVAMVATLSGCMRFTADLELDEDNTVSGSYVFAVEEGTGESLASSDREVAEELYADSGLSKTLTDPRQRHYSSDGFVGTEITFRDEPLSAFAPTAERFGIVRDGNQFVVSGPVSATSEENADVLEGAEMTLSISFPGEVTEHNGTLDGRTVTWNLVGGPDQIYARGGAMKYVSPLPGVITTIIVMGAAAALMYRRVGSTQNPATQTPTRPRPRAARPPARASAPPPVAPRRPNPRPRD